MKIIYHHVLTLVATSEVDIGERDEGGLKVSLKWIQAPTMTPHIYSESHVDPETGEGTEEEQKKQDDTARRVSTVVSAMVLTRYGEYASRQMEKAGFIAKDNEVAFDGGDAIQNISSAALKNIKN